MNLAKKPLVPPLDRSFAVPEETGLTTALSEVGVNFCTPANRAAGNDSGMREFGELIPLTNDADCAELLLLLLSNVGKAETDKPAVGALLCR